MQTSLFKADAETACIGFEKSVEMNLPPPSLVLSPYSLIVLVGSLVLSTFLETFVWAAVLRARLGISDLVAIGGWTTLVQALSTPLSFAISLLAYAPSVALLAPYPSLLVLMLQVQAPISNPISATVGFLLMPILLEYGLWRDSKVRLVKGADKTRMRYAQVLSESTLAGGAVGANLASFSVGILLAMFADGWYLVINYFAMCGVIGLVILRVKFLRRYYVVAPSSDSGYSGSDFGVFPRVADSKHVERTRRGPSRKNRLSLLLLGGMLVFLAVISVPLLFRSTAPASYTTYGYRSEVEAVAGADGTLHVVWFSPGTLSRDSGLVYRHFSEGEWFDTEVVADIGYLYWRTGSPSLAYNGSSQVAVGWIAWVYEMRAYYRLLNGTTWQGIQRLPGMWCHSLDLEYDANGHLHALWADFNGTSADANELYHWEVGSGKSPTVLVGLDSRNYSMPSCRLIHDRHNHLYAFWEQYYGQTSTQTICARVYVNNSWSGTVVVASSPNALGEWDAAAGTNGTMHVVWCVYGGQGSGAISHCSGFNATWGDPVLLAEDVLSQVRMAADHNGTLLVTWFDSYLNKWICRKFVDNTWDESSILPLPPGALYASSDVVLPNSSICYVLRDEAFGFAGQLMFYALDNNGITGMFPIDPVDLGVVLRLQSTALYQGLSLLIGIALFSPIPVHLLRRCLGNLLVWANRIGGA